jgi:hypothetical protein
MKHLLLILLLAVILLLTMSVLLSCKNPLPSLRCYTLDYEITTVCNGGNNCWEGKNSLPENTKRYSTEVCNVSEKSLEDLLKSLNFNQHSKHPDSLFICIIHHVVASPKITIK